MGDYIRLLFGIGTDIPGMGHLWYISTILVCYLITPFVSRLIYPKTKWIALLLLMAFSEVMFAILPGFTGAWINCYVFGLLMGKFYNSAESKDRFLSKSFAVSIPCTLIICGMEILLKYVIKYPMIGILGRGANTIFHYGHIALAIAFFSGLILLIHRSCFKLQNSRLLDITDKYSYDAYLVHLFFVLGPYSLFIGRFSALDIAGGGILLTLYIVIASLLLRTVSGFVETLFYKKM